MTSYYVIVTLEMISTLFGCNFGGRKMSSFKVVGGALSPPPPPPVAGSKKARSEQGYGSIKAP